MKKCAHCGKEYVDEVVRCSIDGELLAGDEAEPSPVPAEIAATASPAPPPASLSSEANPIPGETLTDRETRIFEVVLVCVVAFGGSILLSTYRFANLNSANTGSSLGALAWANSLIHEGACLALLWYVLMRRSRAFSDIGFSWAKKDFGLSILLYIGATVAYFAVHNFIGSTGLSSANQSATGARVANYLFGGGIAFATILVQFLNPFYEELIVRAYLMTELKLLTNSVSKPIIISTLFQMSYHFYQGAPMAFGEGASFLIFSIYYSKTNRITPIILAHLYSDVGGTLWYVLQQHAGPHS